MIWIVVVGCLYSLIVPLFAQEGYVVREGTNGIDNIVGDDSPDWIDGKGGNDQLYGMSGDDVLIGGPGADLLNGGPGIDVAKYFGSVGVQVKLDGTPCSGGEAQGDSLTNIENVEGTEWNDAINGDSNINILNGFSGADDLRGLAGDDQLFGGPGDDVLWGGAGGDYLNGGPGIDEARYAGSSVTIDLSNSLNNVGGDAQGDVLVDVENILGTLENDFLTGDSRANTLNGNDGDDTLHGGLGGDTLIGEKGEDILFGGPGDDLLDPGRDSDMVDGGSGIDTVTYTGEGIIIDLENSDNNAGGNAIGDVLIDIENVEGTENADSISGDSNGNTLHGRGGDDKLMGHAGSDILDGGNGNDILLGGVGADSLTGGPGADNIDGGEGIDTVKYRGEGVTVDLSNDNNNMGGEAQGDQITNVENVEGTDSTDVLIGDYENNVLDGRGGNDWLDGRQGNDVYRGGQGVDTFVVRYYDTRYETVINDFDPSSEIIQLLGFNGFDTYSDIAGLLIQNGLNVDMKILDATLVMVGVSTTALKPENFVFGPSDSLPGDGDHHVPPVGDGVGRPLAFLIVRLTLTAPPVSTSEVCTALALEWGVQAFKVKCTISGPIITATISRPSDSTKNDVNNWTVDAQRQNAFAQLVGIEIVAVTTEEILSDNNEENNNNYSSANSLINNPFFIYFYIFY